MAIARAMFIQDANVKFVSAWSKSKTTDYIPSWAGGNMKLPFRLIKRSGLLKLGMSRAQDYILREIDYQKEKVVLQIWPDVTPQFIKSAQSAGAIVAREMINTHVSVARKILEDESARLGLSPQHKIDSSHVELEIGQLDACDLILSPSAAVDASLAEMGVPPRKIFQTSFGWDPNKFTNFPDRVRKGCDLQALFVGQLCVRKGVHLALEAWSRANVRGRFLLVGGVDPDFKSILARYLENETIEYLPFTDNIAAHYRNSDFLIFPTLEEGAPLVCYEATGNGLPCITSQMGTARIIVDGVNGLVVDPHDRHALAGAIESMRDAKFRAQLGEAARKIAAEKTWRHAAQDRLRKFAEVAGAPLVHNYETSSKTLAVDISPLGPSTNF